MAKYIVALLLLLMFGSVASAQPICWDTDSGLACLSLTPYDAEIEPTDTPTPVPTSTNVPTPTFTPTPTVRPTSTMVQGIPTPVIAPTQTPRPGRRVLQVNPGQSIGSVLLGAQPGDVLSIHAGTYNEQVNVRTNAVTFSLFGDGPVIIDGGCTRANGIAIGSDDVAIYGLTVQRTLGSGIQITIDSGVHQAARTIIENSTVTDYNCNDSTDSSLAGIAAYYSGSGQRIVGNTITRRVLLPGTDRGPTDGIWFKSATGAGRQSGGGHYIAYNTITGGWDGIGGEVEGDAHGTFDQNTVIERNTIKNCADDGIQLDGGGKNVYAQYNTIRECGSGVSTAPMVTGPTYVVGNDIESSTFGDLGQLICFKVGNASASMIVLTGNRCVPHGGKGVEQTNFGYQPIIARSNTFIVDSYAYEFVDTSLPPATMSLDYDCIQASDPSRFAKWRQVAYGSLSAFQAASGQELHATLGPC